MLPDVSVEPFEVLRGAMPKPGFEVRGDDSYRLNIPDKGLTISADRVRREHHELIGELSARSDLPGSRTVNGNVLSIADLNFSSARARQDRAKLLASRANTKDVDWHGIVESFCQQVIEADRAGQPAMDLRQYPKPGPDDSIKVCGLSLPRRHASILFGDGGTVKSYMSLYLAGRLAEQGLSVVIIDWELAGEDHRDRLERLFPDGMPRVWYVHCHRPLVYEVDRLRRIVRDAAVDFAIYDSVAFACDGPPESAEVAGAYFRAVRQIGVGSLHIAHISKAEGADRKPFGSTFWHNGARSTWFVKMAEGSEDGGPIHLGFFNRKSNLGRLQSPLGLDAVFGEHTTIFTRSEVADSPDLSGQLTVRQKMFALLRRGSMAPEAIAEAVDSDVETVKRTMRRYKTVFTAIDGGRLIGLLERRA